MSIASGLVKRFVDVRKNEIEPAFLFFFFWFSVIIVFQILKPLKKGLFVNELGAYIELYAKLANIGVAILAVILFTYLYNRLGSRNLILALCSFFTLGIIGFVFALGGSKTPGAVLNWTFYLFGDAWSTIWVTTFWAYLNEMTGTNQSKRLYGLIGGGAVIGGFIGNLLVWQLVENMGSDTLLGGCAAATVLMGLLVLRAEKIARRPESSIGRRDTDKLHIEGEEKKVNAALEGAKLVKASKYLLAIVMIVFLYELVSQVLDYQYSTAAEVLEGEEATQAFFGQIGTIIGVVSIVTQLFLVSFVIRTFGMRTALLVLPVAMALASGIYFAVPILWTAAFLSISDNAFSYSINQTARETLFMPTSSDVKYKARAFINMFVQRIGKGAAILMALGLAFVPVRFLSLLAGIVSVIWIFFALYAGKRFDEFTSDEAKQGLRVEGYE